MYSPTRQFKYGSSTRCDKRCQNITWYCVNGTVSVLGLWLCHESNVVLPCDAAVHLQATRAAQADQNKESLHGIHDVLLLMNRRQRGCNLEREIWKLGTSGLGVIQEHRYTVPLYFRRYSRKWCTA
jgi:hypothetical protein